jgi:UDP-glucose 4-epimerase
MKINMAHSPHILITGATGAVGPLIVQACFEAGWRVRVFALDAPVPGLLPDGVEVRIDDVIDSSAVTLAMQDCEAVIHLAALLHIVNPPLKFREKYEQINIGGTATVVDAAIKAGVKRLVLASTIAVYGPSGGRVLNEESVACPDTFYGQTKLAAEKLVLTGRRADGQHLGTVLRFGAVYGGRIKGNYRRLVQALARGRFMAVGDGSNRRTLIYDKDLARAAVLAVYQPEAAGQVFNVTDGRFHTLREIMTAMCLALGRTPPRYSLPVKPVRWVAGLLEDAAKVIGRPSPIVRATIDKYIEDIAVSGDKIRYLLGFEPQYDLASGWCETVEYLRQTGDL